MQCNADPSHPLTASVGCSALISAVEDTCGLSMISDSPVRSQVVVVEVVVACLPTGASSPGYRLSAAVHLPGAPRCQKYPLCTAKCALPCTPDAQGELYLNSSVVQTLLHAENNPQFPPESRAVSLKEKGPTT